RCASGRNGQACCSRSFKQKIIKPLPVVGKPSTWRSMTLSMNPTRRQLLGHIAGAAALIPRVASAQSYPTRPVLIISGFPPGGINDTYAHLIGHWLSERLGQQFVVENRPGAGGNIAAESVARAVPNGYTLLLCTSADAWNATLYENLKYSFI